LIAIASVLRSFALIGNFGNAGRFAGWISAFGNRGSFLGELRSAGNRTPGVAPVVAGRSATSDRGLRVVSTTWVLLRNGRCVGLVIATGAIERTVLLTDAYAIADTSSDSAARDSPW
jgi:hypothetical protein